jgi:hypothetical protein
MLEAPEASLHGLSALARHPDRRLGKRYRARSIRAWRDGGTPTAVLLVDRSLLVNLGIRRLARHAAGLARNSGDRDLLCCPAIPDLELVRPQRQRARWIATPRATR